MARIRVGISCFGGREEQVFDIPEWDQLDEEAQERLVENHAEVMIENSVGVYHEVLDLLDEE